MGKAVVLVALAMICVLVILVIAAVHAREKLRVRSRAIADARTLARQHWLGIRATDAERQMAISVLGEAYALGQLVLDEHNERVASVLAATTNADVQRQLAGLGTTDRP